MTTRQTHLKIFACCVLFIFFSCSPAHANIKWNTFVGGPGDDQSTSMTTDAAGNIYLAGTSDADWGWGTPVRAYSGGIDGVAAKFDSDGNYLWHTFLGGTGDDVCGWAGIAVDGSGTLYLSGSSTVGWTAPVTVNSHNSDGFKDGFVAVLDNGGNLQWNTFMGCSGDDDNAAAITFDASGNIYVSGASNGAWGGPTVDIYSGGSDGFAAKLGSGGALIWNTFMGSAAYDEGGGKISVDGSGNVYVGGSGQGDWGTTPAPIIPYSGAIGNNEAFALKLNSSGIRQWHTFMGGATTTEHSTDMVLDGSGNVYMAIQSGTATWNLGGNPPVNPSSNGWDCVVVKLNNSGVYQWHTFIGSSAGDRNPFIAVDGDENVYLTGSFDRTWGTPINAFSGGTTDSLVAKLDNTGNLIWHTFLGGTGADPSREIGLDATGDLIVAGFSDTAWGTTPVHGFTGGLNDAFAAKLPNYAEEPTSQASNITFSSVTGASMTVNWTRGGGANCIVLMKAASAVNSNPAGGTSYAASSVFGSGDQVGTGNYAVYNGTGSSVAITGLTPGETFHFAVYEFNGTGGSENYLTTSPAAGNQLTPMPPPGNAMDFDGVDDYVEIPDAPELNFGPNDNFTVSLWVKIPATQNDLGTNYNTIIDKWGSNGYPFVVRYANIGGIISCARWDNATSPTVTSSAAVNDNQWHHIAFIKDGPTLYLYINGVLNDTQADTTINPMTSPASLSIGCQTIGPEWFFTGRVDEVRIWNIARSQTEIQTNMRNIIDPGTTGLVAYYRFDQGSNCGDNTDVTTLYDLTSNSNDGTLTNFFLTSPDCVSNWTTADWNYGYPYVITDPATNITDATADSGVQIIDPGDSAVTVSGVCWDASPNPDTTLATKTIDGTGAMTGLSPNTTYYVRAYGTNASGTSYGVQETFNTIEAEPTVQASAVNFASVTDTAMTVNWTDGDGSNRLVLMKAGGAVDAGPIDGATYTANAEFGGGTQIGTGNYVVYNGTGNSMTVTGLSPGVTYHVAVYEFNGAGGTEDYLTISPALGSQIARVFVQFTTAAQSGAENGGVMTITCQLSVTSGSDVVLPFTLSGTAVQTTDYTVDPSPVTIPAGVLAADINVTPADDDLIEPDETVILTLGTPINATASGTTTHTTTILNDDYPPVIDQGTSVSTAMDEDGAPTPWTPPAVSAVDVNGDTLTWSTISGPTNGIATVGGTGASPTTFTYVPNPDFNGTDSFVIQVADGNGGTDTITVNVTVNPVNDAPEIAGSPPATVAEGALYSFTPAATDPDGDALAFSIANKPVWAVFDAATGGLFGTPGSGQVGTFAGVEIRVSDGSETAILPAFDIAVTNVNNAPVLDNSGVMALAGILEDATDADNPGTIVADLLSSGSAVDPIMDEDADALEGIAIVGADGANGQWQYDAGAGFTTFPTVSETAALLLSDAAIVRFVPDPDVNGLVDPGLTFRAWDRTSGVAGETADASINGGNSAFSAGTETARINVAPVNDAPSFTAADPPAVTEDAGARTIPGWAVFDPGPADEAGQTAVYTVSDVSDPGFFASPPSVASDGTLFYAVRDGENGSASFGVMVRDNGGIGNGGEDTSAPQPFTISVTPVNDPPVAEPDSYVLAENAALTVPAPGLLGNDGDPDGDALAVVKLTDPQNGVILSFGGDGSFTYAPDDNFNGVDSFTYKASDGQSESAEVLVSLTVTAVADAPAAADDGYTTREDTPLNVVAPGVLSNDFDAEGDLLSAILVSEPAKGTLSLSGNGAFLYTPADNFNGTDAFTYNASDDALSSNIATVTIMVTAVNDAPVALADAYDTDEETPLTIAAPGVLSNDSDVENDPLSAVLLNQPANGALTLNGDGSFTYTPSPGFSGGDAFTYKAGDGVLSSSSATASISVAPRNDAPALDNTGSPKLDGTPEDVSDASNGGTSIARLLSSDAAVADMIADPDPEPLEGIAVIGMETAQGRWQYDTGGGFTDFPDVSETAALLLPDDAVIRFVPDADANGLIDPGITFRAWDRTSGAAGDTVDVSVNGGGSAFSAETETARINITPVNDAPSFTAADPPAVAEDAGLQTVPGWAVFAPGPANEADQTAVYVIETISDPSLFAVPPSVDETGTLTYAPASGRSGTATFGVWVRDSGGVVNGGVDASPVQTFSIGVGAVNDAPVIDQSDAVSVTMDEDGAPTAWAPPAVSASDEDGDVLTWRLFTAPAIGTAEVGGTGASPATFIYAPDPDFNGADRFAIQVADGNGGTDEIAVAVTVDPVNDAPVISGTPQTRVAEGVAYRFTPAAADVDGDPLTFSIVNKPPWAAFDDLTGALTGTPENRHVGVSSGVEIRVSDGAETAVLPAFDITVTNVNNAPVLDNTGDPALDDIPEDASDADNPGTEVGDLLAHGASGRIVSDEDPDALSGIAIFAADAANGQWQYDVGDGWTTFPVVAEIAALLLSDTAKIRFVPDADFNGSVDPGIGFRAWDRTTGAEGETADVSANGGATAFSAETETAAVQVLPVDDPPLESPSLVYPEDGAALSEETVVFQGSAFTGADGPAFAESLWQIREEGRGYGCPTYPDDFNGLKKTGDLTTYEAAGFHSGRQYYARVGYVGETGDPPAWSEEISFRAGVIAAAETVIIPPGDAAADFDMVSCTLRPRPASAASLFGERVGDYDPTEFLIGGYDPIAGDYVEFGGGLAIEPGRAYWFFARNGADIRMDGDAISMDHPIEIPLRYNPETANGWNMTAPPNGADYDWSAVQVVVYEETGDGETPCDVRSGPTPVAELAADNPYLDPRLWRWEGGAYHTGVQMLQAHRGYWVKARGPNVFLRFPPEAQIPGGGIMVRNRLKDGIGWVTDRLRPRQAVAETGDHPPAPPSGFADAAREAGVDSGGGGCFIENAVP